MASPAPAEPPVAPASPGAGRSGETQEAHGSAAGGKQRAPLSALSAFSCVPARREGPPELSYFHRQAKRYLQSVTSVCYLRMENEGDVLHRMAREGKGDVSTYDAIFKVPEGYNKKLHRCDREHANSRGLNINEEEMARPVAVLSSSEYGRRINKPIEHIIREHGRINHMQAEFYRKNGITCLLEKPPPSLNPC